MPEINNSETGSFCWAELSTTDPDGAKTFYTSLFGWDVDDMDIPGGGVYSMYKLNGRYVGASSAQRDEEKAQGVPPHWNLYVSVDDADSYAKKAEAAGGTILAPAFDVMDAGRMAVVADPTGGVLGLWQSGNHRGFGVVNEPGAMSWNELLTPDLDKVKGFYTETFGWEAGDFPTPDGNPYTVFTKGEKQVAGAMKNPQGMEDVPPSWRIYYEVADCDATAAKVKELGGQIYFGPDDVPSVGRFASCADPQNAAFSLLQPEPSAQQG
jgi:uncharacterized protein